MACAPIPTPPRCEDPWGHSWLTAHTLSELRLCAKRWPRWAPGHRSYKAGPLVQGPGSGQQSSAQGSRQSVDFSDVPGAQGAPHQGWTLGALADPSPTVGAQNKENEVGPGSQSRSSG